MKKIIILTILVFACFIGIARSEYISEELYVLPWGWDNDQQLPYAVEDDGNAFGPYKRAADPEGNIYLAFPYRDFRKYDATGKIVFRKEIKIYRFAVDDSQNVYFTKLDPDQLHILRIIDKVGNLKEGGTNFQVDNKSQKISWILNRNGKIFLGNLDYTADIEDSHLNIVTTQLSDPMDSKGVFYYSATTIRRSNKEQMKSYGQQYVDLVLFHLANGEIIQKDTVSVNICRFPQQGAEVTEVDSSDNIYVWIYYGLDLSIDFVVLDSTFKVTDRIELVAISQSMGLWLRPYVLPDGTIYEFRDLKDGLHVIRWTKKE